MPSYVTPKKNTEYIFYVGLKDQTDTRLFKTNPTIAAGDFKVSTDGGALNNLTTLPVVTPASSKMVKITLSAAEMNGDNVTFVFSDVAGAEWCDVIGNIQTSARQLDDLAFPTTSGRSLDVTATGAVGLDWGNVENPTTSVGLSGTTVGTCTVNTDMRGTDSALLASSAPANFGDLAITVTTGRVTVGTNADKTGYSISGTLTTLDALDTAQDTQHSTTQSAISALNNISAAQVNAEVDTAIADVNLDHLVGTATAIPAVPAGTYLNQIMDNGVAPYDRTTDSLQAIRDTEPLGTAMRGTDGAYTGTPPTVNQIADGYLDRDPALGADTNPRSPRNAMRLLRNKSAESGGTLTVYKEDDTTVAWTAVVTTDAAALPITAIDPA